MKPVILLSITLIVVSAQDSAGDYDTGAYIHDTTGDFGPYYYWKLRQQAKEQERTSGVPKPAKTKKKIVSVRKPVRRPTQQQPRFANFQAEPTAPAAPVATQQRSRQTAAPSAPVRQPVLRQPQQPAAPAFNVDPRYSGLRWQFQIQAPEFNYENNLAENYYAFTSPLYATTAQGGSYSYSATY